MRWSPRRCAGSLALTLALAFAGCGTPAQPGTPAPAPGASATASTTPSPPVTPTPDGAVATPGTSATGAGPSAAPSASGTTTAPSPSPSGSTRPSTARPPTTTPPAAPTTAPAGCAIPAALRGKDLTTVPTSRKVIALTFDGGSTSEGADSILATLAAKGVPATFFLTGDFADAFPSTARRIAASYPVGNHTQNHPDLTTLSDARVRAEIEEARVSIEKATGVDPRPYFRFPFGAVDAHRIALVNDACYVPFRWTTDTLGWQGTSGGRSAASVTQRVLDGARTGGIVLMHLGAHPTDRSTLDADALGGIIDGLRSRGYGFVTLEAVLPAAP